MPHKSVVSYRVLVWSFGLLNTLISASTPLSIPYVFYYDYAGHAMPYFKSRIRKICQLAISLTNIVENLGNLSVVAFEDIVLCLNAADLET